MSEKHIEEIREKLFKMNENVDKKMKEHPDNWALFGWKGDILELLGYIEDLPIASNLD